MSTMLTSNIASIVGSTFVTAYYTNFVVEGQLAQRLDWYSDSSSLSYAGCGTETAITYTGKKEIALHLSQYDNFLGPRKVDVRYVDIVPLPDGSVSAICEGTLYTRGQTQNFVQTFILSPTPRRNNTYYIAADCLRYLSLSLETLPEGAIIVTKEELLQIQLEEERRKQKAEEARQQERQLALFQQQLLRRQQEEAAAAAAAAAAIAAATAAAEAAANAAAKQAQQLQTSQAAAQAASSSRPRRDQHPREGLRKEYEQRQPHRFRENAESAGPDGRPTRPPRRHSDPENAEQPARSFGRGAGRGGAPNGRGGHNDAGRGGHHDAGRGAGQASSPRPENGPRGEFTGPRRGASDRQSAAATKPSGEGKTPADENRNAGERKRTLTSHMRYVRVPKTLSTSDIKAALTSTIAVPVDIFWFGRHNEDCVVVMPNPANVSKAMHIPLVIGEHKLKPVLFFPKTTAPAAAPAASAAPVAAATTATAVQGQ